MSKANVEPHDWSTQGQVYALPGRVLVHDMEHGESRTQGGIILTDDINVERGIRPRWATVYATGRDVQDVKVGERILIAHGRWTRGVKVTHKNSTTVIRMVELDSILGVLAR
jgi:co-chaperonin GroES (HSP10)